MRPGNNARWAMNAGRLLAVLGLTMAHAPCRAQAAPGPTPPALAMPAPPPSQDPAAGQEQDFEFKAPPSTDDASTPAAMRDLAERILPVYQDADIDRYLAALSVLQLVAGSDIAANDTRQTLQKRRSADTSRPVGRGILFDLYARAKAIQTGDGVAFGQALGESFHDLIPPLSNHDAYVVTTWLRASPLLYRDAVEKSLEHVRDKDRITLTEAIDLLRNYLSFETYRSFGPYSEALIADDDKQRYVVESNVPVNTGKGSTLLVTVMRPKIGNARAPALLEFLSSKTPDDARASAAHGYAGVVAYAPALPPPSAEVSGKGGRQKHELPGPAAPFDRVGEYAQDVIGWIAAQDWSDGRVGMLGAGYSGYVAWVTAARAPPALKAIAVFDAMAPGIDFPMKGQIFVTSAYRWAVAHSQAGDAPRTDSAQWRSLDQSWYASGKSLRMLEKLAGVESPLFRSWLDHPNLDRFWQKRMLQPDDFARIGIPVLAMGGYFSGGAAASLYYFQQHMRARPGADDSLIIGPYDSTAMRDKPTAVLRGYGIDPVAQIDLREVRYQWFDHIFKAGAPPAPLLDRINFQVMGANVWKHAPGLDALSNGNLEFFLDMQGDLEFHRMSQIRPMDDVVLEQSVDFADRVDANETRQADILGKGLINRNGISFVSEPVMQPIEITGQLSGQLDLMANKRDLDLSVTLYELMPDGNLFELFDPYEFRASYSADPGHRHLLKPGARQQLDFRSSQVTSRKLQVGSRLVLAVSVNKRPDREINYGTGRDVSTESIADAKVPLSIRWFSTSHVAVPINR